LNELNFGKYDFNVDYTEMDKAIKAYAADNYGE